MEQIYDDQKMDIKRAISQFIVNTTNLPSKNINKKYSSECKKILIVDDQDYNISAISIILKYVVKIDPNIFIDKAFNGIEAFDKITKDITNHNGNKCTYHLILMDCNMPFMDGY